jgi:3-oxoacyl-[acyl-carrier protein] reductase
MTPVDLDGKRVLITGAASGIGFATARAFGAAGATVAVNYLPSDSRGPGALEELLADGISALAAPGDVSRRDSAETTVAEAVTALCGLDVLVNNAGITGCVEPPPFEDLDALTEEFWSNILATNLIGPFWCTRAAADQLRATCGAVVNTASVAAFGGRSSSIAYAASKAGLVNLTRTMALALAPHVRVNAVAPGLVRTPLTEPWPEERKQRAIEAAQLKRMVEPGDVAQAIVFVSTNRAITGQILVVDCGLA